MASILASLFFVKQLQTEYYLCLHVAAKLDIIINPLALVRLTETWTFPTMPSFNNKRMHLPYHKAQHAEQTLNQYQFRRISSIRHISKLLLNCPERHVTCIGSTLWVPSEAVSVDGTVAKALACNCKRAFPESGDRDTPTRVIEIFCLFSYLRSRDSLNKTEAMSKNSYRALVQT